MGSATGGEARAAHCPRRASTRLLLRCKKNARPRGTGEVGRRSRIFRRLMAARPPTRHAPASAFCSRSTQHFLPTHGTLSAHSAALRSPAGPGRKRTGLMCTEARAGGGAWERERRGTSAWDRTPSAVCVVPCHLRRRGTCAKRGGGRRNRTFSRLQISGGCLSGFGPCAKSVGRPLFLSYYFSHHFSPLSALGTRGPCAEAARLDEARFHLRRLERRARGTDRRAPNPLQKVSTNPYFYSTSFLPLTIHTLRARGYLTRE